MVIEYLAWRVVAFGFLAIASYDAVCAAVLHGTKHADAASARVALAVVFGLVGAMMLAFGE